MAGEPSVIRGAPGWVERLTDDFLAAAAMPYGRKRRARMAVLAEVHMAVLIGHARAIEARFPTSPREASDGD